jgi:TonB family protein
MSLMKIPGILILFVLTYAVSAQSSLRDDGIKLYKQGDDKGAIAALEKAVKQTEFESDAEAWNTLGLAHLSGRSTRKARRALEKAVSLKPDSSVYHANLSYAYLLGRQLEKSQKEVEKALALDPNNADANYIVAIRHYWEGDLDEASGLVNKVLAGAPAFTAAHLLKSEVLMSKLSKRLSTNFRIRDEVDLMRQAVEVLETAQKSATEESDKRLIAEKLESMSWFYNFYSKSKEPVDQGTPSKSPSPNVIPYKITYQPKAVYTEDGRIAGAEGSVRLAIHLGANGKVLHVLKLWGIGYGLDEEAIKAAKAIRFEPKMVDGKPVPVVIIREYTFDIY